MVSLRHDGFDPGSTDQTGYVLRRAVSLVLGRPPSFLWDSIQRRTLGSDVRFVFSGGGDLAGPAFLATDLRPNTTVGRTAT